MNRVDRLFAITLILQRKKRVRAQDLAETFEVSERTIPASPCCTWRRRSSGKI